MDIILASCAEMQQKGYKYVCFDSRDFTAQTDVSESLGLSASPPNAFTFFQISAVLADEQTVDEQTKQLIFAADIAPTTVIDLGDPSIRQFVYKEDDTDSAYEPIPKYFWRGIASKLNVSGISIGEHSPDDRVFFKHSVLVWRGAMVSRIKTLRMELLNSIPAAI